MSIKAHVVLQFGKTRVELYRHWGGSPEITGADLLTKLANAPGIKERAYFHDGGYVLRQMLGDSDGSLPQYQVFNGLIGRSCDYGYHLEYSLSDDPNHDVADVNCPGSWSFHFSELEGWETLEDWLPNATKYSIKEFTDFVSLAIDKAIEEGVISDLALRDAFLATLNRHLKQE